MQLAEKVGPLIDPLKVEILEAEMLKHEQVDCPVNHRFGPGVYMREVHLPKDALVVGHHQNFEHVNVVLKGKLTLLNEDGTCTEIKAPMTFNGKPGRKIAYVQEDIIWLNVYPNIDNGQDVEALESKLLTKSEGFQLADSLRNKLLLSVRTDDQRDFETALMEIGISPHLKLSDIKIVEARVANRKLKIAGSKIHGKGLIAVGEFVEDEFIGPVSDGDSKTEFWRYVNHSAAPNAELVKCDGMVFLKAKTKVYGCRGGFDGDEITIDYRQASLIDSQLVEVSSWQE